MTKSMYGRRKNFLTLSETLRHNFWKIKKLSDFHSSCFNNSVYTVFIHNERNRIGSLVTPIKYVFFFFTKKKKYWALSIQPKSRVRISATSSSEKKDIFQNFPKDRLRVVPHLSSGIGERAKRERAWKSPHARKSDTPHPTASRLSRVGWFSRALAFRSLCYPWGQVEDYS